MAIMNARNAIIILFFLSKTIKDLLDIAIGLPNVKDHRAGEAGSGASTCWADLTQF